MGVMITLQERFRFFLGHAGYCSPPGRAACALGLARAEVLLERACSLDVASVEWVDDFEVYALDEDNVEDARTLRGIADGRLVGPLGCAVRVNGETLASLWGIVVEAPTWRGDDPYLRVVAAELASEMVDDLRQAIGDDLDAAPVELLPILAGPYAVGGRA